MFKHLEVRINESCLSTEYELQLYQKEYPNLSIWLGNNYSINLLGKYLNFTCTKLKLEDDLYTITSSNVEDSRLNSNYEWIETGLSSEDIAQKKLEYLQDKGSLQFFTVLGDSCKKILASAINQLGYNYVFNFEDFNVMKLDMTSSTFTELLKQVISWYGAMCPHRMINCYLEGNTIYVVQRGYESKTVELKKVNNVVYEWSTVNNVSNNGYTSFGIDDIDVSMTSTTNVYGGDGMSGPSYLNGHFSFGGCSLTFDNGYLIQEKHDDNVTTWSISGGCYNSIVQTDNKTYINKTAFSYSAQNLARETTSKYTIENGKSELESQSITYHYPVGGGYWATAVEEIEDGKEHAVSLSIGQGASHGEATRYSIEKSYRDVTKKSSGGSFSTGDYSQSEEEKEAEGLSLIRQYGTRGTEIYYYERYISGTYSGNTSIPADWGTIHKAVAELAYIEGRTEEKLICNAYDVPFIDLNTRVLYNGNSYSVRSNTITQDYSGVVQNLELVRWL